jgi:acetyl esterase
MKPRSLRQRFEGGFAEALLRLPGWMVGWLAGPPVTRDGYTLEPRIQLLLNLHRRLGKKLSHELPVAEGRRELEDSAMLLSMPGGELDSATPLSLSGPAGPIPARLYRPHGCKSGAPALIYFHGGGFALGSLDSHDGVCRGLASGARCVVVSVDYRLAPEHRFPAAVVDAVAAFRDVVARAPDLGLDPARLAVGGDSAGGNLSAVITLETRADEVRPCFQLLVYPGVDMTLEHASIEAMGRGFLLERASIEWFLDRYLPPGHSRRDPRASPLHAASVAGVPPAFVATAGFDPLRDEGKAYAEKLTAAGVSVEHRCYGGLVHGFLHFAGPVPAARAAFADLTAALGSALGSLS